MLDREDDDLYVNVRLSDEAKENLKQKMNANNE